MRAQRNEDRSLDRKSARRVVLEARELGQRAVHDQRLDARIGTLPGGNAGIDEGERALLGLLGLVRPGDRRARERTEQAVDRLVRVLRLVPARNPCLGGALVAATGEQAEHAVDDRLVRCGRLVPGPDPGRRRGSRGCGWRASPSMLWTIGSSDAADSSRAADPCRRRGSRGCGRRASRACCGRSARPRRRAPLLPEKTSVGGPPPRRACSAHPQRGRFLRDRTRNSPRRWRRLTSSTRPRAGGFSRL